MWVTRDENQHLICAESAKEGLPFARAASPTGRVMRSTTLLLLAAAAAAHYDQRSLPDLCQNNHPQVRVNEAMMLTLWHPNQSFVFANCSVRLQAPPGHMLGIAYLSYGNETDRCPIKLDLHHNFTNFPASAEDLCTRQKTTDSQLPNMYIGSVTLVAHGPVWPPEGHALHLTAIGLNKTCLDKQRYYPCVVMDTPSTPVTKLLKFCVPQSVVCDGLLNCPASGADEISLLCNPHNDTGGSTEVSHKLHRLTELTHLEHYNIDVEKQKPEKEEFNWWWYMGATCFALTLVVAGIGMAAYCKSWNKSERESQISFSLSNPNPCPEHQDPPPDYKSIFPTEEPV